MPTTRGTTATINVAIVDHPKALSNRRFSRHDKPPRLDMTKLDAIAPIIWAKWGGIFLEALRQESLDTADGLAFRALNSDGGIRTLLIVCTTDRAQIHTLEETLDLHVVARPADWESYSVAEMIFKTEKCSGLGHQELRDDDGRTSLVLCATRPELVRTLEKLFDLPE